MKSYAAMLMLAAAAAPLAPATGHAQAGQTIVVNVSTLRNNKGALGCRLFAGPDGFPTQLTHKAQQRVAITGSEVTCTFTGVAPGSYAVAVVHDENGNNKVDTNFLGIPKEGYGVSNDKTYSMSQPKWNECKFPVVAGKDVNLKVTVRY